EGIHQRRAAPGVGTRYRRVHGRLKFSRDAESAERSAPLRRLRVAAKRSAAASVRNDGNGWTLPQAHPPRSPRPRHRAPRLLRRGFWFNTPPPLWIRVNKLHNDRETYRLRLAAGLIDAEPGEHPQSLRVIDPPAIRDLPGYADGDFAVQDHAAMLVASAVNPQ